ncbi:MAG: DUF3987 domain-containing protein [Anaerolineales bacterium]|nr:DUF3987 domain-containing protein [Anaerolineales bacterium]
MITSATSHLSDQDAYVLARVLVGLPWTDLPASPVLEMLLTHHDLSQTQDMQILRQVLGTENLRAVLQVDPNGPAPAPRRRAGEVNTVPSLPTEIRLTPHQRQQAAEVGQWLAEYVTWASGAANETPLRFHEGAGLWLGALAIGRRLCIHTPWGQAVYPNLFVMAVAVSTYYRKSAGLSLAGKVAHAAIPHLLLPQPGSPEAFMSMLGGVLPPNFETIPSRDRERLTKGNRFAAQRGILRDELSALFKSFGRDFMSGMKELIMQLYDCPDYLDSHTNQRGLVVINDAALSILGAATPAELSTALTPQDWFNGALARFALLTPEADYSERPTATEVTLPEHLVQQLRHLHEALPVPTQPDGADDVPRTETWSLNATEVWEPLRAYEQVLRAMTAPNSPLDDRLRTVYGRLHVHALKVAIILAALDWIALGDRRQGRPVVRAAHWYRAQQIVENWRASAHQLLHDLGDSEEARLEIRILKLLAGRPGGLSVRDIYRALRSPRKPVIEALKALEVDGQIVQEIIQCGGRGRPSECYRIYGP